MTTSLDLNCLPLANAGDQNAPALPGLHMAVRPRRVARGRHDDRLIIYLTLVGDAALPLDKQEQLFTRLSQTYYKTSGSVTAALKNVAGVLNHILLERNTRSGSRGQQVMGGLNLIVVRGEQLYLAHCGPAHTFLISSGGAQHFHDPDLVERGLGLAKSAPIRYFQAALSPDDSILISPDPPSSWNAALLNSLYGQGPESLRRRLSEGAQEAALIQVKKGTGRVFLLRPRPAQTPAAPPPASRPSEPVVSATPPGPETPVEASEVIALPSSFTQKPVPEPTPSPESHPAVEPGEALGSTAARPDQAAQAGFTPPPVKPVTPAPERKPSPRRSAPSAPKRSLLADLARSWVKLSEQIGGFTGKAAGQFGAFVSRMLPGEMVSGISSSVMVFFAIAIPLVVVTVATVIYFRSGRASQYEVYLSQAQQAVSVAQAQTDPHIARDAWENVLTYLDLAEIYASSPETQSLRNQANQKIDELDGVRRLNFLPALNDNLPVEVQIARLAATDNELFMLNATDGSVLRATSVTNGYDRDETFHCVPGITSGVSVSPLIDFVTLPKGNKLTSGLLAMDGDGDILNCEAGVDAQASQLTPPPTGFGKLKAFALDLGNLYVLDPEKNAVWIYWKSRLDQEPELFFSDVVPPMTDVIDLAVNEGDLYLLHADGHMTRCVYSGVQGVQTQCTEPLPYKDSRPGYEGTNLAIEAPFTQMLVSQPPDPSLYTFEPQSKAIYHFSLKSLTLHNQFRPARAYYPGSTVVTGTATAFTISTDNRFVFIASGNQVDFASFP